MRHFLALAACCSALLGLTGHAATNAVVNLSHYDEATPNFSAMKAAGIKGVIHEVTYPPSVVDEKYATRQAAALKAGLLWGAYHFANGTDPVRQADFFINSVSSRAQGNGVLMVLDFEQNTHYPGGTMTVPQAVTFIERVFQRTGKYPGLYASENRIKGVLNGPAVTEDQKRVLRKCWLWVANYHYAPTGLAPWNGWKLWQYTGDGICDLPRRSHPIHIANVRNAERNLYAGSASGLASFWQENAWRP